MTENYTEIKNYYLNQESIWNFISVETTEKLREHSSIVHYKKNEILYSEGNFPKGLYIIKEGVAKLQYLNNDGKEQIIYLLGKNEMYGYRSLILNHESYINVTAITNCDVEIIEKTTFLNLLEASKELNTYLLRVFARETIILFHKISFFTQRPIVERIALTLLILAYKFSTPETEKKQIDFPKTDIANFAGTILETFSRQLKKLRTMGIVKTIKSRIIIENEAQLIEIANI